MRISLTLFVLACLISTNSPAADEKKAISLAPAPASLLKLPPPEVALPHELIALTPAKAHHFNLEAPSRCPSGEFYTKEKNSIRCQMPARGRHKLEVYVCDDANTFCRKESFDVAVKGKPGEGAIPPPQHTALNLPQIPGFLTNLNKAIAQAKREKKLLLMNYSSEGCPPCEDMQTRVFPRPDFQAGTADLVKVYVDARDERFADKILHLKPYSTPTFFVLTPTLEEIDRFSGYFPAHVFLEKLKAAREFAGEPIASALVRWKAAETAGKADALELAELRERVGLYFAGTRDYTAAEKALATVKSKPGRIAYLDAKVENAEAKGEKEALKEAIESLMEGADSRIDTITWAAYYIKYYLNDKDPDTARKFAKKALPILREARAAYDPEKNSTSPQQLLRYQAMLLELLERKDEAAQTKAERASLAETAPGGGSEAARFRAALERANAFQDEGKTAEATKTVVELVAKYPQDPVALLEAANFFEKTKDYTKAREHARRACAGASGYKFFDAKLASAWNSLKLGESADTIAVAREVLAKFRPPKSPAVWSHYYSRRARELLAMAEGRLPLPEEKK